MVDLALILLFLALLWAGKTIVEQNRVVRQLTTSMQRRHPFLREREKGTLKRPRWRAFCREINALVEERNRLASDRAGQVGQLEATLQNIQEAVLIINSESGIVLANNACRLMFPHVESFDGRRLEGVLQSSAFLDYVQEVLRGEGGHLREVAFTTPGGVTWTEVNGSAIPGFEEPDSKLYLFVLHDITRLKRLEAVRTEIVANVSHELRTPLSMIKGYVETLTDDEAEVSAAERQRFLRIIQKHTERLNLLLDDLLTLSRLEGSEPQIRREAVTLEELVPDLAEDFADAIRAHRHSLVLKLAENPVAVSVDVPKMAQVFQNLIANAVKYSPDGSTIEVGTEVGEAEVRAWVRDNGVGISREDLPHIFERFYRVDKGRSRGKGGTGLGLSIVKHIVQLHGGRVWAESAPGEGTTILFTIPRPADPKPEAENS